MRVPMVSGTRRGHVLAIPAILPTAGIALAAVLAGCGGSSGVTPLQPGGASAPASTSASTSPLPSTSAAPTRAIRVRISGGKVTPAPATISVAEGTRVALTVVSDRDDEVHVHGYNIEKEIRAGVPGTLSFVADQVGRVEVETHKSGLTLFELVTR